MTTLPRACVRLLLAAALCASGIALSSPRAVAAPCAPNNVVGDLDSDGLSDLVVPLPDHQVVQLSPSGTPVRLVTRSSLGLGASGDEDAFGKAVVVADFNADGCADLAIGSPGVPHGTSGGSVYVAFGSATGVLTGAYAIHAPAAHFQYGYALAYLRTANQLVVGAPYADDGTIDRAGAITVHTLDATGHVASSVSLTQNSPDIPGTSETGDQFGQVLAGSGRTIVVGAPLEDVGTRADAGAVTFLSASAAAPARFRGRGVTQDTSGVPGAAEAGDQFGETLAVRGNWVVVGVPHEDISGKGNTGSVQPFTWTESTRSLSIKASIDQSSSRIPGVNESGDLFGSSLAIGKGLVGTTDTSVIIGAYGEDVGTLANAGAVTVVQLNAGATTRRVVGLTQPNVGGTDAAYDHFGMAVATLRGDDDVSPVRDGLAIGTPGEDVLTATDSGAVHHARTLTGPWSRTLYNNLLLPPAGIGFGYALAPAAG